MPKKKGPGVSPAMPQRKRGARTGFVKATFSLEPGQLAALQLEAMRRAQETGTLRPDASAIVREMLDSWIKRR